MVSRSEGRPSSSPRNRKFFARPSPWRRAPNPLRWVVGLASCLASPRGGVSYIKSCTFARRRGCWQCHRYGYRRPMSPRRESNPLMWRINELSKLSYIRSSLSDYDAISVLFPSARCALLFAIQNQQIILPYKAMKPTRWGAAASRQSCIAFTRALLSRRSGSNRLMSQVA